MLKYEGHITIAHGNRDDILHVATLFGMKYSCIQGWDETGTGVHQFLTDHGDDATTLLGKLRSVGTRLNQDGIHVIRIKIEETIYDERYT